MHTSILNSFQFQRLVSIRGLVKIILPALIFVLTLIYAFYHFSSQHWIFLALFTVAALAISFRVVHIQDIVDDSQATDSGRVHSDGGALSKKELQSVTSRKVSHDGGSFERSTSTTNSVS